jgi:penicillin-binding protein 1A
VGGIDFKTYKYDHANINTKRQVGSTIKPLLYSLAIEEAGFTPSTTVYDVQQSFGQYGMVPATTKTCTGAAMPMAMALAKSRNCATAYIMKQLDSDGGRGSRRFIDFLRRCDLQAKLQAYPSIAIGACEISLFEMMQAYSMFPGRGFNAKPMYITRIEDRNGNVLATFTPRRKEVISDITAYSVIKMMEGVLLKGTGAGIWRFDPPAGLAMAGKTGTTNDNSDAWFLGYTPQLLAGGWVGADDRIIRFNTESKNGEGGRAAMPIWAYFMKKAAADPSLGIDTKLSFVKPDGMLNDIDINAIDADIPILNGEGEGMGTGSEQDYEIPKGINLEDIIPAESQPVKAPEKPKIPPVNNPGKTTPPANTPVKQQPKATMPKKTGIPTR